MKTIQRSADIALVIQGKPVMKEDKPFSMSFRDFLNLVFENDARCQATFSAVRACGRIDAAALREGVAGGLTELITLADEDHAFLVGILADTQLPSLPLADGSRLAIGKQLLPFVEAVEAAT